MRFSILLAAACSLHAQPLIDYHQHFFSPATAKASGVKPVDAAALVAFLDAAGIHRALVLSTAYQFGNPNRPPVENEYQQVKAENDWTAQQAALFPERLRAFCGFNPLKDYALQELHRCAEDPRLRYGMEPRKRAPSSVRSFPQRPMCPSRSHIWPDPAGMTKRSIRHSACLRMPL